MGFLIFIPQIELPDRDWRADPNDGLRPLKKLENL